MAMAEFPGPYDVREYKVRSRGVTTNTCPMAPYRGVSRPAITLSMERLMDCAAARLGIDPGRDPPPQPRLRIPLQDRHRPHLRRRLLPPVARPRRGDDRHRRLPRAAAARRGPQGRYIGVGFSVFNERSGYGTPAFAARSMDITPGYERVEIAMDPSGHVEVRIGASPHGQGLQQALRQLIADILGLAPDDVQVIHGDTDATPYGWGTFASRSMVISRRRLQARRREARRRTPRRSPGRSSRPTPRQDRARRRRGAGLPAAAQVRDRRAGAGRLSQEPPLREPRRTPGLMAFATYDPPGTYSNACHAAVVEVDVETGGVRIERFVAVEDAGLLINPMIADGQVHGGIAQGIANALLEEIVYDASGNILTASLADFLPPTASEIPPIEIRHLETITDASITGAKGLGEGGTIGAPAAVINAICDALRPLGVAALRDAGDAAAHPRGDPRGGKEGGGMTRRTLTLTVNGVPHTVAVEPRRTLADALREDCGLTGTHLGCEHGVCGACTVLVDGDPVRSCLMFAVQADGREIRTVEGLAKDGVLHPMQEAFSEHHALQCGFCTPGFLMLAVGALERNPEMDEDAQREMLSSNLCRCTGYQNILKAVRAAAEKMR